MLIIKLKGSYKLKKLKLILINKYLLINYDSYQINKIKIDILESLLFCYLNKNLNLNYLVNNLKYYI